MTRKGLSVVVGLLAMVAMSAVLVAPAFGQERDPWSAPFRLSSAWGEATEGSMVADLYGHVHVFWAENGFEDERSLIMYSRFDGQAWSEPVSVYASWPGVTIGFLSPAADRAGNLHLAWSESVTGPIYYSTVALADAFAAPNWSAPSRVDFSALKVKIQVDSEGVVHLLFVDFYGEQPGIYYTSTANGGKAWSYPTWLDPDIPANGAPSWLDFDLDDRDGLHVVWSYDDKAQGSIGRWVRYSHSLDGGETWSKAFSIDYTTEVVDELRMPNPSVIAGDSDVHVVWAGTADTQREHRFSTDGGETWSETEQVFGNLLGQAIGDGLATDSLGRIHFAAQLRFPMAIYHAVWDQRWLTPEIAYFIKQDARAEVQGQVGAHNVRLAIGSGNQLVMTFTTGPQDPQAVLYTMARMLSDAPHLESIATPTATPRPTLTPLPPTPTTTPAPTLEARLPLAETPSSDPLAIPLWIGLLPVAGFVGVVVAARMLRRG
jgi:hypothetical protein